MTDAGTILFGSDPTPGVVAVEAGAVFAEEGIGDARVHSVAGDGGRRRPGGRGVVQIAVDALLQSGVDDDLRGRVFTFYDLVFNVAFVTAANGTRYVTVRTDKL